MKTLTEFIRENSVNENNGIFRYTVKSFFPKDFESFSKKWEALDPAYKSASYKGVDEYDSYLYGVSSKNGKREMVWKYFPTEYELSTDMKESEVWKITKGK